MQAYQVVKYSKEFYTQWNDFVRSSKNSTFLFHRDFMEYHKDRFEDYSLMVFKDNKVFAILPANKRENKVYSHQGLSYGGFLLPNKLDFETVLQALKSVLIFLHEKKLEKLFIKQIPKIYCNKPSDELDYLMFILKTNLYRRDVSMAFKFKNDIIYSTLRKREIKKAQNLKLKVVEDDDFSLFWNKILKPNLKETFNVAPVHSHEEITTLKQRFPNNIKQFNVFDETQILAGCTVFETNRVAHLQYISTNKDIKKGALDYLIHKLITDIYKDKVYFDFGISNENEGKNINLGLLNWKQSFGASAVVHDFYEIDIKNYSLLNNVMI